MGRALSHQQRLTGVADLDLELGVGEVEVLLATEHQTLAVAVDQARAGDIRRRRSPADIPRVSPIELGVTLE